MIGDLGPSELLVILAVMVFVFGGSKLPDLARGSGRALRIFKAEVNATDDDPDPTLEPATGPMTSPSTGPETALAARQAAERAELRARHEAERNQPH